MDTPPPHELALRYLGHRPGASTEESPARSLSLAVGAVVRVGDGPFDVGRAPVADLPIASLTVSARHLRLRRVAEALLAEDLRTVNGTAVNGARISAPVVLRAGDRVEVGLHFAFEVVSVPRDARRWLRRAPGGVWSVHHLDAATFVAMVREAARRYEGPRFGGLDLMPPNPAGAAWIFLGDHLDVLSRPEVAEAARRFEARLDEALALLRAGVRVGDGGAVQVSSPTPLAHAFMLPYERVEGAAPVTVDEAAWAHLCGAVLPRMPEWIGLRDGAPTWLGCGMAREGDRIVNFHSSASARRVEGGGVTLSALGTAREVSRWIADLGYATGWY